MKKFLLHLHKNLYIELLCFLFLVLSFCFEPINEMFEGYGRILTSSAILVSDYTFIGGMGAAFFNVATTLLLNIIMIRVLKIDMSGAIYCGLIMVAGFAFFGKNIYNAIPIYFGIWLYSKMKKIPYKTFAITILFSSGLSPLVSYPMFGFGFEYYISIPLGILCGIIVGFIIPAFVVHTMSFHEGYTIYNAGFAFGLVATLFNCLFLALSFNVKRLGYLEGYDGNNQIVFYIILYCIAIFYIIVAFIAKPTVLSNYKRLTRSTGRLISYYIRDYSHEAVMLNFGIVSICMTTILAIFQIPLNGILFGCILAALGSTSFGMHIRNVWPVWVGAIVMIAIRVIINGDFKLSFENGFDVYYNVTLKDYLSVIITFVFSVGLSPICGKYGIAYGLVAGAMHTTLPLIMINAHGGLDLYNNGFSTGIEAAILAVCAEKIFNREKNDAKKSKGMSNRK